MRLPQHQHLIGGEGCFNGHVGHYENNVPCDGMNERSSAGISKHDLLPRRFRPLPGAFLSDEAVGWSPPPCDHRDENQKQNKPLDTRTCQTAQAQT